jgi:cytidylate kinase
MSVIAIDGPAGAGKSTISRKVAEVLGWRHIDTGAMYRALTLAALQQGIGPTDEDSLIGLLSRSRIEVDEDMVLLDGRDVSAKVRSQGVGKAVSAIAAHPRIRRSLIEEQRRMAADGNVVMEGRDIGSAVLPEAGLKVFLTASLEERARRRVTDDGAPGSDLGTVTRAIAERDKADSERAASPLVKAADALTVDTTGKTIDQVVDEVVVLARRAFDGKP